MSVILSTNLNSTVRIFFFLTRFCQGSQAGFEIEVLLPQSPRYFNYVLYTSHLSVTTLSFLLMVTKYLTVFSISGNMGPSWNYAFLPLIAMGSRSLWVGIPNVPQKQLSSACFWNAETDCRTPTESTMPSSPENMKDAVSQPPLLTAGVASGHLQS